MVQSQIKQLILSIGNELDLRKVHAKAKQKCHVNMCLHFTEHQVKWFSISKNYRDF